MHPSLAELDAKGPVIYQLKVDYDASQQGVQDLQSRLTAVQTECNGLRLDLDDALGQAVAKDRECQHHKMAARDLRQQVRMCQCGKKGSGTAY